MDNKSEKYDSTALDFALDLKLIQALHFISEQAWRLEVFKDEKKDEKLERLCDKATLVVEKRVNKILKGAD